METAASNSPPPIPPPQPPRLSILPPNDWIIGDPGSGLERRVSMGSAERAGPPQCLGPFRLGQGPFGPGPVGTRPVGTGSTGKLPADPRRAATMDPASRLH